MGSAQLVLSGVATAWTGWWALQSLVAIPAPRREHAAALGAARFAVIVPAHNEESLIAGTVQSLSRASTNARVSIYVVADNCVDRTPALAAESGATVLERTDPQRRGKNFALDFGLAHLGGLATPPDYVVVVDADTQVSPGFFGVLEHRLATGCPMVQAHYAAATGESDVARMRRLAFALVHWSRPLGASRLGLPTTLKGNGMAFRWDVIRDGFPGEGITEDASATLQFARRGLTVTFEPAATVWGLMADNYSDAATQDQRWEGGRLALMPKAVLAAISQLARGRIRPFAAATELASPPLTVVAAGATLGLGLATAGFGSLMAGVAGVLATGLYVFLGLAAARPSASDVTALAHAPRFVIHKLLNYARLMGGRPRGWHRTAR